MRVLFTPHLGAQHLYPLVPLAWACRAAGHEVRIAGSPSIQPAIVRTGLPAVLLGADLPAPSRANDAGLAKVYEHRRFPADWPLHPELLDDEQRETIELLGRRSARAAEYAIDELIAYGREWRPDLIVHDIGNFAGPVAAAVLGVPNVRHLTGVGLRPMENRVGSSEPLPEYAALFARHGLAVRPPSMTIDPSPPSLRLPVPEPFHEVRYVPYNGPGEVPHWVAGLERPRVCVTWGLSVSRVGAALAPYAVEPFRLTVSALAELPAEVVVTTTPDQLALLGDLPGNVRAVTGLPLHVLLPFCDLIVHQAGDGTALTAAACGVPQLPVTRKPDPALTGGRLEAIGAAIHLRYQELVQEPDPGGMIRNAAEKLLADAAYHQAALLLQAEMARQPSPADLVGSLEALGA
jgi:UDP:flavonoid glycosyltransferase YjiC (YdhE family)